MCLIEFTKLRCQIAYKLKILRKIYRIKSLQELNKINESRNKAPIDKRKKLIVASNEEKGV